MVARVLSSNKRAWEALTGIFPEVKATEVDAFYSKKGKLRVKMFGRGKRAYDLYTVYANPGLKGYQRQEIISPKSDGRCKI